MSWTKFRTFPNPQKEEYIYAPFGYGVYELYDRNTDQFVLFGRSKNVAARMASLLKGGSGNRNNQEKIEYVTRNLNNIVYRTKACKNEKESKREEAKLRECKGKYTFPT